MSYQVLARKWRPRFFDEMVGQEHVLKALINALNEGRLHHAYLFTGTRGVGKTTIARILAKCLNCEQGVSARPCGECTSCREIAEGRFIDLIEVDAASRTKVEDTRELLDNVQYAPTRGRYKVYLIDEVHMLSSHSFNALLKTLEEPPEHVKFLLATTDPQKLPVTVLSRCLQFSLKNMTPERIVDYLAKVLNAEEINYEEPALWSLGRAAQGSMRDALSLTDQAIAYGQGSVGESQVNAMLGTMNRGRLFRLAEVMAKADAAQVLAEVAEMSELSPDYDEIIQGLLHIWHKASLGQLVPDAIDNTEGDKAAILQLAQAMSPEDLQLYYQVALQGRQDLALAPEPRQGFEMVLLRMLAFRPAPQQIPDLDLEGALEKKKSLTAKGDFADTPALESPSQTAISEPAGQEPVSQDQSVQSVPESTEVGTPFSDEAGIASSQGETAHSKPVFAQEIQDESANPSDSLAGISAELISEEPAEALLAESIVGETEAAEPTTDQPEEPQVETPLPESDSYSAESLAPLESYNWWQWVERLPLAGLPMAIARNSSLISRVDQEDSILFSFDVDPAQAALYNESQKGRIEQALQSLLPTARIEIDVRDPRGETPDQRASRLRHEAHYSARQAIETDPLVDQLLTEMGGRILEDTVRPIDEQQ